MSSPAFTPGGLSAIVTTIVSETVTVPSETVRVNSMSVFSETLGASKVVSTALLSTNVMVSGGVVRPCVVKLILGIGIRDGAVK